MDFRKTITTRHSRLVRLYLFAFLFSLTNWAVLGASHVPDTPGYLEPAIGLTEVGIYGTRLSSGEYEPSAYRTPGTTFTILPFYFLTRNVGSTFFFTTLFYSMLAPLLPLLTFQLGKCINPLSGYIGYSLMLLHANMHYCAVSIMSDLPFAAVFSLGNILLLQALKSDHIYWRNYMTLGICFGVAALVRPTGLYWAFGASSLLLIRPAIPFINKLKATALVIAIMLLVVTPWVVRNAITMGAPTMDTIKGSALLWSFGSYISLSPDDSPEISRVKSLIAAYSDSNSNMYYYHKGYDGTLQNQVEVSETLKTIALEFIRKNPEVAFQVWRKNLSHIFLDQSHYESWLYQLHASPVYRRIISSVKPAIPRIDTKIYHINLEMKRLASVIVKYFAIPGFLLLLFLRPMIGLLQLWNVVIIASLTALVSGYDRFRLPLEPIISAFAGVVVGTLLLSLGYLGHFIKRKKLTSE